MSKNKGFAKVEIIANLPEIKALHENGFNKRMIYDHLVESNKITMTYQNFCAYNLNGVRRKNNPSPSKAGRIVSIISKLPDTGGDGSPANNTETRPFNHDNQVTLEEVEENLIGND
ncbi:TraK family protein [Desulfovibrio sp. JC010]|uniref:TraK family protein n=1 Tax=Desulfovibrio sp. JC010 TaxID=2593641 RepID=UPI0013D84A76|nr:TraK family protein [Desulfovibrio sp. JC010]NDV28787.1 hypothetical protein [Desulfovibrio sp. JC010]